MAKPRNKEIKKSCSWHGEPDILILLVCSLPFTPFLSVACRCRTGSGGHSSIIRPWLFHSYRLFFGQGSIITMISLEKGMMAKNKRELSTSSRHYGIGSSHSSSLMKCCFCVTEHVVMHKCPCRKKEDSVKQFALEQEKCDELWIRMEFWDRLIFVGPILSVLNFGWVT